jgi:integrase
LFAQWPQAVELELSPKTIISFILEYSILTATRPLETLEMPKSEYHPEERLWIIPWQRHKEGRKTRQDHVIPLSPQAIEILELVTEHQRRDGIKSDYMFASLAHVTTNSRPGELPSRQAVRNFLRAMLGQEFGDADLAATVHGMRTAFRSWAQAQRRDGMRLYDNDVVERAINHIGGYGKTETIRIYNRDTPFVAEMVPLFEHWARYCYSFNMPATVVPIRRRKQAAGG